MKTKHSLQGSIIHNIVRLMTSLRGHFLELGKNKIAYSDFLFLLKNVSRFCIAKSVTIFNNSNGNLCICDINI